MSKGVALKFIWVVLLSGAALTLGSCTSARTFPPSGAAGVPGDEYPYASPASPAPGPPSQLQAP
jgi:hypothetical protein